MKRISRQNSRSKPAIFATIKSKAPPTFQLYDKHAPKSFATRSDAIPAQNHTCRCPSLELFGVLRIRWQSGKLYPGHAALASTLNIPPYSPETSSSYRFRSFFPAGKPLRLLPSSRLEKLCAGSVEQTHQSRIRSSSSKPPPCLAM